MISGAVARRYAQALYDLSKESNSLANVESELVVLAQGIEQNPDIQKVLYNPRVSPETKKNLMRQIFVGCFSKMVQNFLDMLIDKRRQNFIVDIYKEFKLLADAANNVLEAEVKSAIELSSTQQNQLQSNLSKMTGKSIRLVVQIDPSLIGGVVVKIGDRVIDGSVAGRLATLRETLVQQ